MDDFEIKTSKDGFTLKLWRGERMCLLGFDVEQPEDDFVGFAVECWTPGDPDFHPLKNRLTFDPMPGAPAAGGANGTAVTGDFQFSTLEAPFQKFRWVHFPHDPKPGIYKYRATKMHMPSDGTLAKGVTLELEIDLNPVTYDGFLDVGFTRNFASSQAFVEKFGAENLKDIGSKLIPDKAEDGLDFSKMPGDFYQWLGFEAYDLLFNLLKEAVDDPTIELDVFAYDLNEPDVVSQLEKLGSRLRVIIDDSKGHNDTTSAETVAAARLEASAGADQVKRTHFIHLQHHKVIIAKRNGKAFKVLAGSTNFSFRGLYVQANNMLVFDDPEVADLYEQVFELAFTTNPSKFGSSNLASVWHQVQPPRKPGIQFCFSPHGNSDLALVPIRDAVNNATSSVLYAIAFLNQITSGPTHDAFEGLMQKPIFSYGLVNTIGGLEVRKPDGSTGLVSFHTLAAHAPEPFKSEWAGGHGINLHHKFVVTDFGLPTAKVFTGSSNFSPSGEAGNGDHLILIEDRRVATSYAIEAIRVFDHYQFRSRMSEAAKLNTVAGTPPDRLKLHKPRGISGEANWFEVYYQVDSQKARDRQLFSA